MLRKFFAIEAPNLRNRCRTLSQEYPGSLCKQNLYVSITQSGPGIEPNGVAYVIRWKSMADKEDVIHLHRLSQMPVLPVNVTMPVRERDNS